MYVSEVGERKLWYVLSIKLVLLMLINRERGLFIGLIVVINVFEYRILVSLDFRKLGCRIFELLDI